MSLEAHLLQHAHKIKFWNDYLWILNEKINHIKIFSNIPWNPEKNYYEQLAILYNPFIVINTQCVTFRRKRYSSLEFLFSILFLLCFIFSQATLQLRRVPRRGSSCQSLAYGLMCLSGWSCEKRLLHMHASFFFIQLFLQRSQQALLH